MTTSEQLELEAEAARARIATSLDELRDRMTPGQIVDQLVDYARDGGGGVFLRNLGRQVVANPFPVTLVGAGLAWLAFAGGRSPSPDGYGRSSYARTRNGRGDLDYSRDYSRAAGDVGDRATRTGERLRGSASAVANETGGTVSEWGDNARKTASDWSQRSRSAASDMTDRASKAASDMADRASEAGSRMRDAAISSGQAISETASDAYESAVDVSRRGADAVRRTASTLSEGTAARAQGLAKSVLGLVQEQPLVLAGIGLALGAMLGASLPATETENQIMGGASDATKGEAANFAQHEFEKGKAVATEAWSAAKPELDRQLHGAGNDPGGEASLVPSDDSGRTETARDGNRGNTEYSIE
jgi:ElaB/YqjD/DUF883 family membrane-anchored ribosome-binding protein